MFTATWKAVFYVSIKYPNLTVKKLKDIGPIEAGSIVIDSFNISYCKGNIDNVLYSETPKCSNSSFSYGGPFMHTKAPEFLCR